MQHQIKNKHWLANMMLDECVLDSLINWSYIEKKI